MNLPTCPQVAVIGGGQSAIELIRCLQSLGALAAICNLPASEEVQDENLASDILVAEDFQDVLSSEVQGIVVANQGDVQYELVKQAFAAGKDIFLALPLSLTVPQAEELACQSDEMGRILMVGNLLEYHPATNRMLELIESGDLGSVNYVYTSRVGFGQIHSERNGSSAYSLEDLAMILRIAGTTPEGVVSFRDRNPQSNSPDIVVTHVSFKNALRAHSVVSQLNAYREHRLVVAGTKGVASFDAIAGQLLLHKRVADAKQSVSSSPVDGDPVEYPAGEPLEAQCRAFLEAMVTRTSPSSDGRAAMQVLKLIQLALRSLRLSDAGPLDGFLVSPGLHDPGHGKVSSAVRDRLLKSGK